MNRSLGMSGSSMKVFALALALALGLASLLVANIASACSTTIFIDEFEGFKPKPEGFSYREDLPPRLNATATLVYQPKAFPDDGQIHETGCGDNVAEFDVAIDTGEAVFPSGRYGYYFRVISPDARWTRTVVPVPINPEKVEGRIGHFSIDVADSPLEPRRPIDVEIEVFAIDAFMRIGPATRFRLQAAAAVAPKLSPGERREPRCEYQPRMAYGSDAATGEKRLLSVLDAPRRNGKLELPDAADVDGKTITCYRATIVPDIGDVDVVDAGYRLTIRSGLQSAWVFRTRPRNRSGDYAIKVFGTLTKQQKAQVRDVLALMNGGPRINKTDP